MPSDPNRAVTVYGPEVLFSGLLSSLDAFLCRSTGLLLDDRFLAIHDRASITSFYDLTSSTSGRHWPLVVDLFEARPCCISVWTGPDALPKLQALKGATQPCQAGSQTVRAGFWCDNPVANLLHVSDNYSVAREEFRILQSRSIAGGVVKGELLRQAFAASPMHCGLFQFFKLISRHATKELSWIYEQHDRDATRTAFTLIGLLQAMSERLPDGLNHVIRAFLSGEPDGLAQNLYRIGPVTAWEKLMIESALHSNPLWMEKVSASSAPCPEQPEHVESVS